MDTKVMDRIMKDYWNSNIDISGHFLNTSTAFKIITAHDLSFKEDYERQNRFYQNRSNDNIRPHPYMFKVYVQSMRLRYSFEIATFILLAILF